MQSDHSFDSDLCILINIPLQYRDAWGSLFSMIEGVKLAMEGRSKNRKVWQAAPFASVILLWEDVGGKMVIAKKEKHADVRMHSDKDSPTTRGDLWASTLLLHQRALRVQTEDVLGSLCWCAETHPLLFTVSNKNLQRTFKLFFLMWKN